MSQVRVDVLDPRKWIGKKVAGRYHVVEELTRGGMGAVFLAVQEPLERNVALKIMLPGPAADAGSRRRFIQEAQALSRIPHRNIVTLFDFGEADDGSLFIAMELVEGTNVREALHQQRRIPWPDTIPLVIGVARALSVAHASGILHRDLKPENIMLVGGRWTTDDVKLLDFGLARALDSAEQLTQVNAIPGTPNYIAPERVVSRAEDPRSDLYSIGAIWFELLTGRLPFGGETMAAILLAHIQEPLSTLEQVAPGLGVPAEIEHVLQRLLAKKPEERWDNADDFLEEVVVLGEALLGPEAFGRSAPKAAASPSSQVRPSAAPAPARPREDGTRAATLTRPRSSSTNAGASRWTTVPGIPSPVVQRGSSPSSTKVRFPAAAESGSSADERAAPATATPSLPGRTALIQVGQEAITVQTEWSESKRAFVSIAFFRGRTLRRSEVALPADAPMDEAERRMAAAHGWFVDGVKELLAERAKTSSETSAQPLSRMFFFAVEAYANGDPDTALRTLESLLTALPDDRRVKNSHMKLLLEMDS